MARVNKQKVEPKKEVLERALLRLDEDISLFKKQPEGSESYRATRGNMIQSFECVIELFWKYLSRYLELIHNILANSSREVIRKCLEVKVLTLQESIQLDNMIDDRNETSHSYEESFAKILAKRIPVHFKIMKALSDRLTLD